MKKFFRVLYKIIIVGIVAAGVVLIILMLSFIHNLGKSTTPTQQARAVSTSELLIAPASTETPTRAPSSTPIGADLWVTLTAISYLPTKTPEARSVKSARVPIYNGNGELIGYVGDSATSTPAPAYAAPVCLNIKGNVNWEGEGIYHCPGWRDYDITTIVPGEGDRYFCTEAEAEAAGFRAANYPHGICK